MREDLFRIWLQHTDLTARPIGDAISRCKRVCQGLNISLDDEYEKDGGVSVVELFEYSAEDERMGKPCPNGIYFQPGSNIRKGMASLKNAIKKYMEFCESIKK